MAGMQDHMFSHITEKVFGLFKKTVMLLNVLAIFMTRKDFNLSLEKIAALYDKSSHYIPSI